VSICAASDIDKLLAKIAANRRKIRELNQAKTNLLQGLEADLRHKAKTGQALTSAEITNYAAFSRHFEAADKKIAAERASLSKKMRTGRIQQEILRPHTNLAALQADLMGIAQNQANMIQALKRITDYEL